MYKAINALSCKTSSCGRTDQKAPKLLASGLDMVMQIYILDLSSSGRFDSGVSE